MGIIVFGGGAKLTARTDADGLMQNLSRLAGGGQAQEHGRTLPSGFVDVETDGGVVYVNPSQVAYVCNEEVIAQAEESRATLGGLEGAPVRAHP